MDRSAIERAAQLAGLELSPGTDVTIDGDAPVLPRPFHLGEGAAVALALTGQEAGRLWETSPHWVLPTAPLGSGQPAWL